MNTTHVTDGLKSHVIVTHPGDGFAQDAAFPTVQPSPELLAAHALDRFNTIREREAYFGLRSCDSLPLDFYEDVKRLTGQWPQEFGIRWCYDNGSIGGEPIALTIEGYMLLGWYRQAKLREQGR